MKNKNAYTVKNGSGLRLDHAADVLPLGSFSSPEFYTQCCVCRKVRIGEKWVDDAVIDHAAAKCSHGYCPVCFRKVMRHIDKGAAADAGYY